MCERVKLFVCLIRLSIRTQPLILPWPSSCSLHVCVVLQVSLSELSFVLFSSLCHAAAHFVFFSLDHQSIPKPSWTDSGPDADKLQRESVWWWCVVSGETCKVQKTSSQSRSLTHSHTNDAASLLLSKFERGGRKVKIKEGYEEDDRGQEKGERAESRRGRLDEMKTEKD